LRDITLKDGAFVGVRHRRSGVLMIVMVGRL
jgi:hypothetical protein